MKQLLILFVASLSIAAADVSIGKSLTQGNVTILLTKYSNRPFPDVPGVPQVAPELLREGVTVTITSTNQATVAFRVTMNYRDGDSALTLTISAPSCPAVRIQGNAVWLPKP